MDLEKIKSDIEELTKDKGLYLYSVEYKTENDSNILEVVFDKDGFVDSDEITDMTNVVNEYLDKADPINENYSLCVTSLGIDKEISFDKCEYYLKENIKVKTIDQEFNGELVLKGNDYITIKDKRNKKINIKANDIIKIYINIVF